MKKILTLVFIAATLSTPVAAQSFNSWNNNPYGQQNRDNQRILDDINRRNAEQQRHMAEQQRQREHQQLMFQQRQQEQQRQWEETNRRNNNLNNWN